MALELIVDEAPFDSSVAETATVEEALLHVQEHACEPGQLIVRVRCNGQDVSGEQMVSTLKKPASSLKTLEVFTGTKAALVFEAMTQASACLEETEIGCRRCGELLTEGNTSEGIDALGGCLHVWQQIHEAVAKSIEMLELNLDDTLIQGESLEVVIGKPKEVLEQVRDALQAQDHVMLADILQYELTEVTTQWFAVINCLRDAAQERGGHTAHATS